MSIVWLLDPITQESYAIEIFETSYEALDYKDRLRLEYPANVFYYTINSHNPEVLYSVDEALLIVNGEDIYLDV